MKKQWFVYKDQQQKGPFSWEQLWQMARSGAVGPADYYWTEGMAGWSRGDQMPELFPRPAASPPPPPAAPPPAPAAAAAPAPPGQPPPPARGPAPAKAPGAAATPAAAFYQQQGAGSGPFAEVPTKSKGRGCLTIFLILILILGLLAAGGYYVYKFYLPEGEKISVNLPLPFMGEKDDRGDAGAYSPVGAWYGKNQLSGEEGYLRFNADGTLDLASPAEGFWTTVEYRLQREGEISYLEFYDTILNNWERVAALEQPEKGRPAP